MDSEDKESALRSCCPLLSPAPRNLLKDHSFSDGGRRTRILQHSNTSRPHVHGTDPIMPQDVIREPVSEMRDIDTCLFKYITFP
jgi:hypothetical protein